MPWANRSDPASKPVTAKAFWTIVDAHVTTLITALALFLFGTGPIKGFAVTLSLGIIFNLFSTLFASRLFYDSMQGKRKLKKLSFMLFLKKPNLDYMRIKNLTFAISGTCALIGCLAFVQIIRGQANMGVDFSGGTLLQYQSTQPFTLGEVRSALAKGDLEGVELQKVEGENRLIVKIKNSEKVVGHVSETVTAQLNTDFPDKHFVVENQSEIGSSVSDTLRSKALLAVIVSLLGVVVYLGLRFDLRFGIAATLATLHDVLAVLGLVWLLNMEITLLTVTALLTLAGYSLNDTVIIFDRIRENQHKSEDPENITDTLINTSTNEVLSRSIVTSLTVFPGFGGPVCLGRLGNSRFFLCPAGGGHGGHLLIGLRGQPPAHPLAPGQDRVTMRPDLAPEHVRPLTPDETFRFSCHPGVACFTDCCRQLDLALSPYDVLRLSTHLGLASSAFLDQYAVVEQAEGCAFPQVFLCMVDDGQASCPFVTPSGCSVYADRPGACRTYPLGRGAFTTSDGDRHEMHVLLTEPHCQGFIEGDPAEYRLLAKGPGPGHLQRHER